MTSSLPSYYLGDRRRRLERSDALAKGVSDGSAQVNAGLSAMAALSEKLRLEKKSEEDKAYQRTRDAKADERAARDDTRADRMLELQEKLHASNLARNEKADATSSNEKSLESARETLKRVVASGLSMGKTPQDIVRGAHDMPALGAITGDEEVEAEYVEQRRALDAATADTKRKDLVAESQAQRNVADANKKNRAGTGGTSEAQRLKNALAQARLEKLQQELANAKPKGSQVQATEAEQIVELQTLLGSIKAIATEKPNIDTGFASDLEDRARGTVGKVDPERAAFRARVGDQLAAYIKSISGATVSEPERAALLQNVPTMKDDDAEFLAKLGRLEQDLTQKLGVKMNVLKGIGRDVSGLEQPRAASMQATATSAAAEAPPWRR